MQQSTESYWNEIKTYEERLKKQPSSYCFAPLAELYLKVGLLDDALSVARAGAARYPGYVAGQMALARACKEKGLLEESRQALEAVTTAVPEHQEAQRILTRLYTETGRSKDAVRALEIMLDFTPDDTAARTELESLRLLSGLGISDEELELIELTEADIYYEEPDRLVERIRPTVPKFQDFGESGRDPLMTGTLAELYVTQGFTEKAINIYRGILAENPDDRAVASRLAELEKVVASSGALGAVAAAGSFIDDAKTSRKDDASPDMVINPGALSVLQGWLENIRRIRECH